MVTYGVIGIEFRMREPSAGVFWTAFFDLAPDGEVEEGCRAGVSRTSLRN